MVLYTFLQSFFEQQEFDRSWNFIGNGHNGSYVYRNKKTGNYLEI